MLKHRPLQEIVPWLTPITPDLVLNKDGSLLASFRFDGIDADSPSASDVSSARDQLDQACRAFDHRITAWWRLEHRRAHDYIDGEFAANADRRLDAGNRANMQSGRYFQNAHSLHLAYTPESGMEKLFEKVAFHLNVGGKNIAQAVLEAAKDTLLARSAFAFELGKVQADVKRFESLLDSFCGGANRLGLKRLAMQAGMSELHQTANPTVPRRRIRYPVTLLDSHLTESEVTVGADRLLFESAHGRRYAAIVAVKEWMGFQEAALDVLTQVNAELDVCILYRFLSSNKASSFIEKVRRFYKMAAFNVWTIIKQYASQQEAEADEGRKQLADEAGQALRRLTADGQQHGFANISVIVYGDTESQCEEAVREVVGAITNAGFGTIVEKANLMPAWNSTLPGRWDKQRRLQFVETPAVSDLAPIRAVKNGPTRNDWLSDKAGVSTPPLTCLPTRHMTAQRVDLHQPGGNGHLLVIGPAGAGKSVFVNFLMSQAGRQRARRIRFDKDRSTRIPTVLAGGKFIDVTGRFQAATQVNPLSLLSDPASHAYLTDWIVLAIEDETFTASAQQRTDIHEAIRILAGYPREHWTLGYMCTLLHSNLRERLQIWTADGQYGRFFDHVEDAFEVSDDLSIEMGDLFQNFPRAAALFVDYAFYRISRSMDGVRYTIIEIEEAGFFFTQPRFYARLETWVVTIRKLNGAIWMATQSLRQVARVADFEILKDNIPNLIFLPNSQAMTSQDLYCDQFGLTVDQVHMIHDAVPNRDYLWVTKTQNRMLKTAFTKEMVAMLRSDGYAQDVLDRHYASGAPGWQDNYVREVLARS